MSMLPISRYRRPDMDCPSISISRLNTTGSVSTEPKALLKQDTAVISSSSGTITTSSYWAK